MSDAIAQLMNKLLLFLPKVGGSLIILLAFWLGARISYDLIIRFGKRSGISRDVIYLLAQVAYWLILVFGVITALGTLGIDVAALVAGLGLTGFALGLALKDILSNLVSGVLILIYHPFRRDDYISVSGFEGKVVEINLRYTILQGEEKQILIPNSSLFTNTISILDVTPKSPSLEKIVDTKSLEEDEEEEDFL